MTVPTSSVYDVLIVGGGISGTALLYTLARFTDLKRIGLVEKYHDLATVNSRASNNSQTIHSGDIETNYSLEKALTVSRRAGMVVEYGRRLPTAERERVIFKFPKMVLGVGSRECQLLQERYDQFSPHFPGMRLLDKAAIADIEPNVATVQGRPRTDELVAIAVTRDYTAVDYGALAHTFVEQACQVEDKTLDLILQTAVQRIRTTDQGLHQVITPHGTLTARFVVVAAGGHSLLLAHQMGFGLNYSCLPMAGSFYFTPAVLRGKVYTVQNDKLPFAAIHGDPDVLVPGKTRFGPTALPLPLLERYNPATFAEFLRVLRPDPSVAKVFWDLLKVTDIRNYLCKNIAFEIPGLNRRLFLNDARKIVPSLQLADLQFAVGVGGIRPQLIDKQRQELMMGQAQIDPGNGILFNVTPSPGATNCLGTAEQDAQTIARYLGCSFSQDRFEAELVNPARQPV